MNEKKKDPFFTNLATKQPWSMRSPEKGQSQVRFLEWPGSFSFVLSVLWSLVATILSTVGSLGTRTL